MISDKQLSILSFPHTGYDALICDGAIRSGKSSLMMVAFIDWAMREFDRCNFGICGKSVGSAVKNVVRPYMAMSYARKKFSLKYNQTDKMLTVRSGRTVNWFEVAGGNDESSQDNIQGRTWAGVLLDEVALMPESFVNQALGRCSVDGSRYWFNCNPASPRHWFYRDWILGKERHNALHLHFDLRDNPSLSDHVIERFESQYSGVFHDRFIKGLWVVAEGLVFQFDSESEYTCSDDEAHGLRMTRGGSVAEGGGEWYVSVDYGTVNPFAALLWRVTPSRAYIVDEYYFDSREEGRRKTDPEHLEAVKRLAGDRQVSGLIVDPSAGSFKEQVERDGRFYVYDANNDVSNGLRVTDAMLHGGLIKISETCRKTIGEMGLYRWNDKAAKDEVVKENDHAMDAMRYMAYTVLRHVLKGYAD